MCLLYNQFYFIPSIHCLSLIFFYTSSLEGNVFIKIYRNGTSKNIIGSKIRQLRQEKGLSQAALPERTEDVIQKSPCHILHNTDDIFNKICLLSPDHKVIQRKVPDVYRDNLVKFRYSLIDSQGIAAPIILKVFPQCGPAVPLHKAGNKYLKLPTPFWCVEPCYEKSIL